MSIQICRIRQLKEIFAHQKTKNWPRIKITSLGTLTLIYYRLPQRIDNKMRNFRLNPKDNEEKSTVKVPSTRHSSRSVCGTSNSTMAINIRLPQSCFVDEFELETISTFKEYVFVPGEFQIILLIDTQENSYVYLHALILIFSKVPNSHI